MRIQRPGVRIDMTPMVDVAFLLLTFFMLTTSMNRPQTMEINLPSKLGTQPRQVKVPERNLLQLRMDREGLLYWNLGLDAPKKLAIDELRSLARRLSQANPNLVALIKIDCRAKYRLMVDIMDEINLADVTRFSLAPLEDADVKVLEQASGA